jgi:hypothetical protein
MRKHFRKGQDQVPIPLFGRYDAAGKQIAIIGGGNLSPEDNRGIVPRLFSYR